MCDKKYNGWTNYETWVTFTWLTNSEVDYNHMKYLITEGEKERQERLKKYSVSASCEFIAGELLKAELEESSESTSEGLLLDLLTSAVGRINYTEIMEGVNN